MAENTGAVGSSQSRIIASLVGGVAIGYSLFRQTKDDDDKDGRFFLHFVHLMAFSIWFGTQIWHSFIASPIMFKNMHRHSFGKMQGVLFPVYFTIGIVLWSVVMATHIIENPVGSWDRSDTLHVTVLAIEFMALLFNALVLSPMNHNIMVDLFKVEKDAGVTDDEKDRDNYLSKVEKNNQWLELRKQFRMAHGLSSIGNLVTVLASMFHLYQLAGNID